MSWLMINPSLLTSDKPLKAKIAKVDNAQVKIVFSDGQSFNVSNKYIPPNSREGDIVYLSLVDEPTLKVIKEDVGKRVLKEILNP